MNFTFSAKLSLKDKSMLLLIFYFDEIEMILAFRESVAFRCNDLFISTQGCHYTRMGNDLVTTYLLYNALIYLLK